MRRPLTAVGIDSDGLVIGVRTLEPNRVVTFLSARYVLEIPAGVAPPPLGAKVSIDDV